MLVRACLSRLRRVEKSSQVRVIGGLTLATLGVAAVVAASMSSAASYVATASVSPAVQFLGDGSGTLFTFTVNNTGTTASIGAVEIARPSTAWTITDCPSAPPFWRAQTAAGKCRYRADGTVSHWIQPGQSAQFGIVATTTSGSQDRSGVWPVAVSKTNSFDTRSALSAAPAPPDGTLTTTAHSFQVLDVGIAATVPVPGAACPALSHEAVTASTANVVVCGRNRTTVTLTPNAANSSLSGTWIGTSGTFTSGAVAPSTTSRVLGNWGGAHITGVAGTGKTVVAVVGSAANRTSPAMTLTEYKATNQPPAAVDDTAGTSENSSVSVAVLTNDSDPDGDTFSITDFDTTGTNGGSISRSVNNLVFDPGSAFDDLAAAQTRQSLFTYTITDSHGGTDTASVTVTVTGANDPPVATDDSRSVSEDSTGATVSVLGNDTDAESQTLSVSAVDTTGTTGLVTNNGTDVTYDPNGQFEYLAAGQTAADTFTYTVSDGHGGTDTATVTVTVTGVNDAPVARDDTASTTEASSVVVNVLANDTDAEGTVSISGIDTTGTLGSVTNNGDGTVTYDPNGAFENKGAEDAPTDTFTYTVSDGHGGTDAATVTVTVNGINDPPVAADDSPSVSEDSTGATVPVLANDTDAESQTLSVSAVDTTGTTGLVTNNGTDVTYDPNGEFDYLGASDTATDTFTYTVSDGHGGTDTATVTVTVTGVNDAPAGRDDSASTTEESSVLVYVLTNDSDAEGGTVSISGIDTTGTVGLVTNNGDGTVTYDPSGEFEYLGASDTATDTFTYTITDGHGGTDTATVTVTVNGINDPPVATDDSPSVSEDSTGVTVPVLGNDTDAESQTLSVSAVDTTGTTGLVTNNGTDVTYDPDGLFESLAAGETATDTFTYTVSDGHGGTDTATVTVTVTGVNDAPVAVDDSYETPYETTLTVAAPGVLSNDTDDDASDSVTAGSASTPDHGTVTLNADGSFDYSPTTGYFGPDSFTYTVSDGHAATDTATVSITVTSPNAAPTADATSGSGNEDGGAITVTLSGDDADGDTLTFAAGTATSGSVSTPGSVNCTGTAPKHCTASVTYTPNANFFGSDSFTYHVNDGTVDSANATASLTVNPVNDAPSFTAGADQTVDEDAGPQSVSSWATAMSKGPANEAAQTLNFIVANNNNGLFSAQPAVSADGTLTFTPAANANGAATVAVQVHDDGGTANGGSDTSAVQSFTITVNAVNDAPSFTKGDDQTLNEDAGPQAVFGWATAISKGPANESGQTVSFQISANDNASLFSAGPAVSSTGTLTYTSAANKYGVAHVTLRIADDGGTANGGVDTSATQSFVITVNAVNDAPVAAAKAFTVQANMKISLGGLLTGASDPNDVAGDASWAPTFHIGSITAGAGCIGCTVSSVDTVAGSFDFDPPAGGTGTFSVTYTVVDSGFPGSGATSAPQTITFTVNGPVIWFVDANSGVNGTGRLSAPFNNLASATSAMGTNNNQRIFVQDGNVTGNVTLQTDGWLISDAATGTTFDTVMGISPPAGTISRPTVNSGAQRTLTGTVTLGTNSVARGFDLTPSSGNKGLVANGKTGLTVNQMSITTAAARAIDLASSSGVFDFKRVTANGGDRGISLDSVNVSTGAFTINGTGTAGTGGVISNSTALGTLASPEGGIFLRDTKNVTLKWMTINNNQANGIYAKDLTALVLQDSTASGNGTDEARDHSGMHFANLLGTSSIARVDVSGSREDTVKILNTSGTANITVANSTFRDNSATVGANGLYVDTKASALMTFTSTSNTFTNNHTDGLAIFSQGTEKLTATVTGGTYTNNGVGLDVETNGTGGMQFSVTGGTVTGCAACGAPVNVYKGSGATGTGSNATAVTITGMTISNGNSLSAAGIWVHGEGAGAARIAVTNNTISAVQHRGIDVSFGNTQADTPGGAQTIDVSVTGNTVNQSTSGPGTLNSIRADAGTISSPSDIITMCVNIANNTINNPVAADIRVINSYSTTNFRLPGYGGGSTDTNAVANFLNTNNPPTTDSVATIDPGANGFGNGAACAAP